MINEVRIGNYVTNSLNDIFKIETGALYLYHIEKEWDVKPIELTEEWLIKFGSDYDESSNTYLLPEAERKRIRLYKISDNCYQILFNSFWTKKIYHVHQLQNLYFALTNKELTI